uniref:Uncharacterized protein n=1 Tax=Arcella intermedia TaxID=1963864 RepID=A0A6B2LC97_9EUKA
MPFSRYVIAGAVAGIAEILCMYPLDMVKTRLQLQRTAADNVRVYNGVVDCFRKIIQQEGFLQLYRGIVAPICAEAPKRAVKFSTNEGYKKLFTYAGLPHNEIKMFSAGLMAGLTEAIFNCPFELLKVRMQAKESQYASTFDAAKTIITKEGISAVFRGLSPQMLRNAIWDSLYFSIIFSMKQRVLPIPKSKTQEQSRNFFAGVVASTVGTTFATPFDCVKSRMQSVMKGQETRWKTVFGTLRIIYREEGGIPACFKGLTPRLLRLAPGGGIMIVAFDLVSSYLGGHRN